MFSSKGSLYACCRQIFKRSRGVRKKQKHALQMQALNMFRTGEVL